MTAENTPREWATEPRVLVVGWLLATASALVAVLIEDTRGRLLLILAAVLLAALSLAGTLLRPRLAADSIGITVRGIAGRRQWRWDEVRVRLAVTRRLGRETTAVEIDADNAEQPALVLLGRLDLGADPQDVVQDLLGLRA
ncbi:PH domain-containing protein [Actinokineospora enzanensis]|uniref:PH domain-containing protein n=1 Tax=Actinokineospora enzanensis TaxID=155975 RepID=UPI00036BF7F3|nr:PH domain-containing protein [Actinokineospora enzanensis]